MAGRYHVGLQLTKAHARRPLIACSGAPVATLQLLQEGQEKLGLQDTSAPGNEDYSPADEKPKGKFRLAAARRWTLLLDRIYECFPLLCPKCLLPIKIMAFIEDPTTVEKILTAHR